MPLSGSFILGINSKSQGLKQRVVHNAGDYIEGQ